MTHAGQQCSCVSVHGGSGQYVFLAAEGGHHRRSSYSRRLFRLAVDGHHRPAATDQPGRLVIADTTQWPGVTAAAWSPAQDGIPEIVQALRLGHTIPGMRGVYTHVSDTMRANLKQALQARWEASLRDRAAISPHSPVPLLDGLLAPTGPPGRR